MVNGVWSNNIKAMEYIKSSGAILDNLFSMNVGNSEDACFWTEGWRRNSSFSNRFPTFFALERHNYASIAERINSDDINFIWKTDLSTPAYIDDLNQL